jgi:Domain of unknown function (DUF4265)
MGHSLVRIVVDLDPEAWHGNASERLWAEPIGENRYRLRNSPFYAGGMSNADVVFGENRDGAIHFTSVSIHAGHSTYRLKVADLDRDSSAFVRAWAPLGALGCSFEEGPVLAVDVPASADIYRVYELLEAGAIAGVWDFEEGHCGHPLK